MKSQSEPCATCGEAILEGQAEFDFDDGRIGLPHHPTCLSMPETLRAKISRCPVCSHMEGRHLEVLDFDESTGKIRAQLSRCTCGCDYYLKLRGVG
jgi:hypothetical protein